MKVVVAVAVLVDAAEVAVVEILLQVVGVVVRDLWKWMLQRLQWM